jgi:hypothetical protein
VPAAEVARWRAQLEAGMRAPGADLSPTV